MIRLLIMTDIVLNRKENWNSGKSVTYAVNTSQKIIVTTSTVIIFARIAWMDSKCRHLLKIRKEVEMKKYRIRKFSPIWWMGFSGGCCCWIALLYCAVAWG